MTILSLITSLKPTRREHWIMLSIILYNVITPLSYILSLPQSLIFATSCICGSFFLCLLVRYSGNGPLSGFVKFIFIFLFIWSIWLTFHMFFIQDSIVLARQYSGNTPWLHACFVGPFFLPNIIPFFLFVIPKKYRLDFGYFERLMWLLCIIYLCYYPFAFWSMTHYQWSFDIVGGFNDEGTYGDFISHSTMGISSLAPCVMMIFLKKYLSDFRWKYFFVAYVAGLLMTAYLGRRGGLAMSLLYLTLLWWLYASYGNTESKFKMILILLLIISILFLIFSNFSDSFFSVLTQRVDEDTRTGVEEAFYEDMKSRVDWISGRGWIGQYYDYNYGAYRSSIETGYLALILRGGLLYLVPYILCLLISVYNGYFRSNNLLCKAFALICFMQIISLYPSGWPYFNIYHFVVWLGVWICNSDYYRKLSDIEIGTYFSKYK